MRSTLVFVVLAAWAATAAAGSLESWKVVKRGAQANAGELAIVGAIVAHPTRVGVRVAVGSPGSVSLSIVMSCRKGLSTRVRRDRLTGSAPYLQALRLPLSGADNCAVSATGTNPAGTLKLELLRS